MNGILQLTVRRYGLQTAAGLAVRCCAVRAIEVEDAGERAGSPGGRDFLPFAPARWEACCASRHDDPSDAEGVWLFRDDLGRDLARSSQDALRTLETLQTHQTPRPPQRRCSPRAGAALAALHSHALVRPASPR